MDMMKLEALEEEERMFSILVVDDDEFIRRLLRETLTDEGYKVETVESGVMAVKKVMKQTIDVLILDIHMTGINGIEVISIIKRINPHLPIITITGDTSLAIEIKVRKESIFYHFIKPFNLEEIKKVVKSALIGKSFKKEVDF